jgi:mannose-6-phosphate isomerase-like protein (cupin superfamily)
MTNAVSPKNVAAALKEFWSPRIVGEVDDAFVKVAKIQGTFTWHVHDDQDEMFYVLAGKMRIEMDHETVELGEGDMYIVPKGVRHNPSAEEECHILLVERKSTLHTGALVIEQTRSIEEQLGQE